MVQQASGWDTMTGQDKMFKYIIEEEQSGASLIDGVSSGNYCRPKIFQTEVVNDDDNDPNFKFTLWGQNPGPGYQDDNKGNQLSADLPLDGFYTKCLYGHTYTTTERSIADWTVTFLVGGIPKLLADKLIDDQEKFINYIKEKNLPYVFDKPIFGNIFGKHEGCRLDYARLRFIRKPEGYTNDKYCCLTKMRLPDNLSDLSNIKDQGGFNSYKTALKIMKLYSHHGSDGKLLPCNTLACTADGKQSEPQTFICNESKIDDCIGNCGIGDPDWVPEEIRSLNKCLGQLTYHGYGLFTPKHLSNNLANIEHIDGDTKLGACDLHLDINSINCAGDDVGPGMEARGPGLIKEFVDSIKNATYWKPSNFKFSDGNYTKPLINDKGGWGLNDTYLIHEYRNHYPIQGMPTASGQPEYFNGYNLYSSRTGTPAMKKEGIKYSKTIEKGYMPIGGWRYFLDILNNLFGSDEGATNCENLYWGWIETDDGWRKLHNIFDFLYAVIEALQELLTLNLNGGNGLNAGFLEKEQVQLITETVFASPIVKIFFRYNYGVDKVLKIEKFFKHICKDPRTWHHATDEDNGPYAPICNCYWRIDLNTTNPNPVTKQSKLYDSIMKFHEIKSKTKKGTNEYDYMDALIEYVSSVNPYNSDPICFYGQCLQGENWDEQVVRPDPAAHKCIPITEATCIDSHIFNNLHEASGAKINAPNICSISINHKNSSHIKSQLNNTSHTCSDYSLSSLNNMDPKSRDITDNNIAALKKKCELTTDSTTNGLCTWCDTSKTCNTPTTKCEKVTDCNQTGFESSEALKQACKVTDDSGVEQYNKCSWCTDGRADGQSLRYKACTIDARYDTVDDLTKKCNKIKNMPWWKNKPAVGESYCDWCENPGPEKALSDAKKIFNDAQNDLNNIGKSKWEKWKKYLLIGGIILLSLILIGIIIYAIYRHRKNLKSKEIQLKSIQYNLI